MVDADQDVVQPFELVYEPLPEVGSVPCPTVAERVPDLSLNLENPESAPTLIWHASARVVDTDKAMKPLGLSRCRFSPDVSPMYRDRHFQRSASRPIRSGGEVPTAPFAFN